MTNGQKQSEYSEENRGVNLTSSQEGTSSLKGVPKAKRPKHGEQNQVEIVKSGGHMLSCKQNYDERRQNEGTGDKGFRVGYPHGRCSRDLPAFRT